MDNQDELIPYIKISRSLFRHFLWKEKRPLSRFEAWLDLIQKASFSDKAQDMIKGKIIEKNKGQVVGSLRFFQEAWGGWSTTKVSDFFEVLRSQNMISIDKLSGITIITLLNFDKHSGKKTEKTQKKHLILEESESYKEVGNTEVTQTLTVSKQSANSQQTNIIKVNKENNDKSSFLSASVEAERALMKELKAEYSLLVKLLEGQDNVKCWLELKKFVLEKKPKFIEPFIDCWNLFALNYKLIKNPIRITRSRSEKFSIRIEENYFDFFEVLEVIKKSDFLKGKSDRGYWKVDFDFIINSEMNYTKILEEKY